MAERGEESARQRGLADAERPGQRDHVAAAWRAAASCAPNAAVASLVGQDHFEPRGIVSVTVVPFPFFELELDRAAMRLDELAGQRQAEAERRLAAHACLLDPVEAVEHARQILLGDARAVIADRITACSSSPSAL